MDAFRRPLKDVVPSSSPAFGTPVHPVLTHNVTRPAPPIFKPNVIAPILPILIPPPSLRPLAFRIFTKKHNLTLSASSLAALATFVGRHCGSGWREEGTGEKALEEVAKLWKNESGGVIVDDGPLLKSVLKTLEAGMVGGRVQSAKAGKTLSRESTFSFNPDGATVPTLQRHGSSFGLSNLTVEAADDEEDSSRTALSWTKVISSFELPRLVFDSDKKHFIQSPVPASSFPPVTERSAAFRSRYQHIYHRLLRNPAFQEPSVSARTAPSLVRQGSTVTEQQFYRITTITNLLGRGGTSHLLLGMLAISPTGMLAIHDPSGSITVDLSNATPLQGKDSAYFVPGMIVLVDGLYEESWVGTGSTGLGNTGGVGGMIGGRFVAFGIGGPPVEKRNMSLGLNLTGGDMGAGLGWTDFLGQGSEKAVGDRMRRLEARLLDESVCQEQRRKAIIIGEVDLYDAATLPALRQVLQTYSAPDTDAPMLFILTGNFTSKSALAGTGVGSIEYKALFDSLAALLGEFPTLLRNSTWTFVPGDRDAWTSAFTAGASTVIPQEAVPDIFTSRVKRAIATAISEATGDKDRLEGKAVWTSNPARISLFGPVHEMVIFRDDIAGRLRRNALRVGSAVQDQHDSPMQDAAAEDATPGQLPDSAEAQLPAQDEASGSSIEQDFGISQARKLVLSILPQSHLSPFSPMTRPVQWSYQSALSLYPLPHSLVMVDAEAEPFAVTFEGCHVLNPGKLVGDGTRRKKAVWAEYDLMTKRGKIRDDWIKM